MGFGQIAPPRRRAARTAIRAAGGDGGRFARSAGADQLSEAAGGGVDQAAVPAFGARAAVVVDLGAVRRNCARIAGGLRAGSRLCAIVKSDGYGHGAIECAEAALAGGAEWLAVTTCSEAAALRRRFTDAPVLILGTLAPSEVEAVLAVRAEIAISSPECLDLVAARGAELGLRPRVHIKHDSGMGRLGERDPTAVASLVDRCAADPRVELVGLWTHFACADEPEASYLRKQRESFHGLARELKQRHPSLMVHAANSAATLRDRNTHYDMVRCGMAVYGLDPFGHDPVTRGLEPALGLHTYLAAVKWLPRGASTGYGRQWRAPADTWVGLLPIGHGDGVRRALTNNADVLIAGRRRPVVGTISMDSMTVDLGPDNDLQAGVPATVIGEQRGERILCEEIATRLATIQTEIVCGISSRVPRVHIGAA